MNQFNKDFIALIKAAIMGSEPVVSDEIDFELLFRQYPRLAPMLYRSASGTEQFKHCKGKLEIIRQVSREIAKNNKQAGYIEALCSRFDEAGIQYCLLKGGETKPLYPDPAMRPMRDCDLLIREKQYPEIREIMQEQGYYLEHASDHEYEWAREDGYEVELHFQLFGRGTSFSFVNTFQDKVKNHYLIPEYSYIYMVCHLAKHFKLLEPTIKGFVDLQVYCMAHPDMDRVLINGILEKMDLGEFHTSVRETLKYWFESGEYSEKIGSISDMVLSSFENKAELESRVYEARVTDRNGRINRYFFTRSVFPSYEIMKGKFPILEKFPVMLPAAWLVRIIQVLTAGNGEYKEKKEAIKSFVKKPDNEFQKTYCDLMDSMGLRTDTD